MIASFCCHGDASFSDALRHCRSRNFAAWLQIRSTLATLSLQFGGSAGCKRDAFRLQA
jgi:hypothetical protein